MMADTTTRMRITKANKLYKAILPGRYMLRTGTSYVSCGVRFPAVSNHSITGQPDAFAISSGRHITDGGRELIARASTKITTPGSPSQNSVRAVGGTFQGVE